MLAAILSTLLNAASCVQSGDMVRCLALLNDAVNLVQEYQRLNPPEVAAPVVGVGGQTEMLREEPYYWDNPQCL